MSQLSKTQLAAENQSDFPNNNVGFITPTILRGFNTDMIDSLVDENSYNIDSSSFSGSIAMLEAQVDALVLSGSGVDIREEGVSLGSATALNFVGASITASVVGSVATINVNATAVDVSNLVTTSSDAPWSQIPHRLFFLKKNAAEARAYLVATKSGLLIISGICIKLAKSW